MKNHVVKDILYLIRIRGILRPLDLNMKRMIMKLR